MSLTTNVERNEPHIKKEANEGRLEKRSKKSI